MNPRSSSLKLAALLALALFPTPTPAARPTLTLAPWATQPGRDATKRLDAWLAENGAKGGRLTSSQVKELDKLMRDVGKLATGRSAAAPEARMLLLGAAGWGLFGDKPASRCADIRSVAQSVIEVRLAPGRGEAFIDWMLFDLLAGSADSDPLVRRVAVRALSVRLDGPARRAEREKLLVGIMSAGRDPDAMVQEAVCEALIGRTEPFVSDWFLSSLERDELTPEAFKRHLEALAAEAPKEHDAWWQAKRMRALEYVTSRVQDPDWRTASRGISLARAFELARVAPFLIESLGVWSGRTEPGSRRIVHELSRSLAALSGRDYGEDATTWARWWQAETQGGAVPERVELGGDASFFGLQPVSDQILFVIDRSGSMREPFSTGKTRYDESIDRLLYTLRDLGPETAFGVVMFSDAGGSFSNNLEHADDATLRRLEEWARELGPGGGTNLHAGLRVSFPGLEIGKLAPTDIPYDTVVVLCDGETNDVSWVAPWLARYNRAARLVFHCVNIGGTPGGVLEALAKGSGGAFIVSK